MVYCNTNWYDNYIDWSLLSGIDVWIARYGDTIQAPDKDRYNYTIWQCTDGNTESGLNSTSGLVAGIPAGNDVDVNFGYVDYTKKSHREKNRRLIMFHKKTSCFKRAG